MTSTYDVAIVGLGAMGSAAAYHLASNGQRVLGLDRFTPPHTLGSSHGETRIIREAYAEHPSYVPIVQRAYQLWQELEQESGKQLLLQTGGMLIGSPEEDMVQGAEDSARRHKLPYERFSAAEVTSRFPALEPPDEMIAIWDSRAGILLPEDCITAYLDLARRHGADLRFDEPAISWEADGTGVSITTEKGQYSAQTILLSAGPWIDSLVPDLNLPLQVERQVLFWFEAESSPEYFSPERCPIYIWDTDGQRHFYGFPDLGKGIKIAIMHHGEATTADDICRDVSPDDELPMRKLLEKFMPKANGILKSSQVCMFTNTPDTHFLIGFHPEHPRALIASPCSGHGFKFASAIGEILSDLLTDGKTNLDISLFGMSRFMA